MIAPRRLLSVIVLVAVFGGFAGFAGYRWAPGRESPRQAWDAISAAAAAGDYGAVYDRFDPASQARMSSQLRVFEPDPVLTDRERFVMMLEKKPAARAQFLPGLVLEVQEYGDQASIRLDRPDPTDHSPMPEPTNGVYLARPDGRPTAAPYAAGRGR